MLYGYLRPQTRPVGFRPVLILLSPVAVCALTDLELYIPIHGDYGRFTGGCVLHGEWKAHQDAMSRQTNSFNSFS